MKRTTVVVIVAALAVMLCSTTALLADELPDFPFVSASGSAEKEFPPDMAIISFRITNYDKDPLDALKVVKERSADVLTFFLQNNIKREDIEAYNIEKRAVRERKQFTEYKIVGYEVSRNITFTLRDLKQYEKVIRRLLSLENVDRLHPRFDRSDRKKIEADLVTLASRNAKENAERIAKGFGAQLGAVFAISQRGFRDLAAYFLPSSNVIRAMAGAIPENLKGLAGQEESLFVPAAIKFTSDVNVLYRLNTE